MNSRVEVIGQNNSSLVSSNYEYALGSKWQIDDVVTVYACIKIGC
jgi:hypothetical protein